MQSVAKFVTKAYPVSGCFDYLSEVRTERESVSVCLCVYCHGFWSYTRVHRGIALQPRVWMCKELGWHGAHESAGDLFGQLAEMPMRNGASQLL